MLFSAWSLCALKNRLWREREKKGGGGKKSSPILGSERATGSGIDQVENLCLVGGDFHVRPDLSHLPGFFCCRKGSGTTGCSQTHREGEEGKDGGRERGRLTEGEIELPLPHIGNINPPYEKKKER